MADRYMKVVLTAIAVALMWLCLWGPAPTWGTPAQAGAVEGQRIQSSPTPWAYHTLYYTERDGVSYSVLLRVNPVTDEMEYFTPSRMGIELGWIGVGPGRAPTGQVIEGEDSDWIRTPDGWRRVPKSGQ
jgi:hypothetical protein